MIDKKKIRLQIRESLATVTPDIWQQASQQITAALVSWLQERPEVKRVSLFAALPNEIDLQMLLILLPQIEWCFPVVNGQELSFHRVNRSDSLISGYRGIMEPNPMVHPPVERDSIDLMLCPGLAFSKDGARLGRGGGYYDRFLSEQKAVYKVGVCLSHQLIESVPSERHDIPMTHIVTESGVIKVLQEV